MRNKRIKKPVLIGLLTVAILLIAGGLFFHFNSRDANEDRVITKIPVYGYILTSNKTDLYAKYFHELYDILTADEVDYEAYAKKIAQLFIADFFDLNSKRSNEDIGGTPYIFPEARDNFKLKARHTIYNGIENKLVNPNRDQTLPIVTAVNVENVEEAEFIFEDEPRPAFLVKLTWEYESDLGYQDEVTMFIVQEGIRLYIIEMVNENDLVID